MPCDSTFPARSLSEGVSMVDAPEVGAAFVMWFSEVKQ